MVIRIRRRRLRPAAITTSVPSTSELSTAASARGCTGGLSNTTRSARSRRLAITARIRSDPSSSAGLGGSGPVVITRRFGCSVSWATLSMSAAEFAEQRGQASGVGGVEHRVDAGPAEVGIDQQDAPASLCEHDRQVAGRRRLALVPGRARHQQ